MAWRASLGPMLIHPIPKSVAGPMGWWYVFGKLRRLRCFMIQIPVTGIRAGTGLCAGSRPGAAAYESLLFLNYASSRSAGSCGHFTITPGPAWSPFCCLVHMTQVFLHRGLQVSTRANVGDRRRAVPAARWGCSSRDRFRALGPRRLLGLGGRRLDGRGRVPVAGPWLVSLMLGGAVIGGNALESLLYSPRIRHPRSAADLSGSIHLWLVVKKGISCGACSWAATVNPKTYDAEYERELK